MVVVDDGQAVGDKDSITSLSLSSDARYLLLNVSSTTRPEVVVTLPPVSLVSQSPSSSSLLSLARLLLACSHTRACIDLERRLWWLRMLLARACSFCLRMLQRCCLRMLLACLLIQARCLLLRSHKISVSAH